MGMLLYLLLFKGEMSSAISSKRGKFEIFHEKTRERDPVISSGTNWHLGKNGKGVLPHHSI